VWLFVKPTHRAHLNSKRRCARDEGERYPGRIVEAHCEYGRSVDREQAQRSELLVRSADGNCENEDVHGCPLRVLHWAQRDVGQRRQTRRCRALATRGRACEKEPAFPRWGCRCRGKANQETPPINPGALPPAAQRPTPVRRSRRCALTTRPG